MQTQFILDENQVPIFAVVPYNEYAKLCGLPEQTQSAPTSEKIPLSIPLPNGGPGAAINLPAFVDYWVRKGIMSMPIGQRAKPLSNFERREWFSVEALVRQCFVQEGYRNTMQVVTEVTARLVATGLFREVRFDSAHMKDGLPFIRSKALVTEEEKVFNFERYSRSVKCLEIVEAQAIAFLSDHPVKPATQISSDWWIRSPFC